MKSQDLKYLVYFYWITLVLVFGFAVFIQGRSPWWFAVMLFISSPLSVSKGDD